MATTKHIHEITPELQSQDINGSELLVVSNPNGSSSATGYDTNKLSISQLKTFINGGSGAGPISNGLVIYDMEDENGLYANTFLEDQNVTIHRTFVQDVRFDILIKSGNISFKLNDKDIAINTFPGQSYTMFEVDYGLTSGGGLAATASSQFLEHHTIDVKAGQEVTLEKSTDDASFRWIRIPLKSGGIFIDTDKMPDGYTAYQTSGTITATDYCLVNVDSYGIPKSGNSSYISNYKTSPRYHKNNSGFYMVEPIPRHYAAYAMTDGQQGSLEASLGFGQLYLRPGDTLIAPRGWVYPIL